MEFTSQDACFDDRAESTTSKPPVSVPSGVPILGEVCLSMKALPGIPGSCTHKKRYTIAKPF